MAKKKITKKKIGLFVFVLILAIGGVAGFFTAKYVTRNDIFEIIGEKTITLSLGQTYQDEGARAISFGRDISSKIVTESDVDYSKEGTYYIKYTVEDIRYRNIERYRTIVITSEVTNENS